MTDDKICGWTTGNGDPCQNPAYDENGNCWIPTHGDPQADNPHGRPSKLDENREDILTAARQGMTKGGCARLAGVGESTLYEWLDQYPDFSEEFKRARAHGELKRLQGADEQHNRWILERSFGWTKTEERRHEHTGGGGGPIDVVLNETVVETSAREDN